MAQNKTRANEMKRGVYISNTLNMINYYNRKSKRAKRVYLVMGILIAIGSIVIPIFVNLPGIQLITIQWGTTLIGFIVASLIATEKLLRLRDKWYENSHISLFIDKEYQFFNHRVGDYESLDPENAFKLYVEIIEKELHRKHLELLAKEGRSATENSVIAPP